MTASSSVQINCPKRRSASPVQVGFAIDHCDGCCCRKMESVRVEGKPKRIVPERRIENKKPPEIYRPRLSPRELQLSGILHG